MGTCYRAPLAQHNSSSSSTYFHFPFSSSSSFASASSSSSSSSSFSSPSTPWAFFPIADSRYSLTWISRFISQLHCPFSNDNNYNNNKTTTLVFIPQITYNTNVSTAQSRPSCFISFSIFRELWFFFLFAKRLFHLSKGKFPFILATSVKSSACDDNFNKVQRPMMRPHALNMHGMNRGNLIHNVWKCLA